MDPDAALQTARDALARIDALDADEDVPYYIEKRADQKEIVSESFRALDEWLSKGAFLPKAWSGAPAQKF